MLDTAYRQKSARPLHQDSARCIDTLRRQLTRRRQGVMGSPRRTSKARCLTGLLRLRALSTTKPDANPAPTTVGSLCGRTPLLMLVTLVRGPWVGLFRCAAKAPHDVPAVSRDAQVTLVINASLIVPSLKIDTPSDDHLSSELLRAEAGGRVLCRTEALEDQHPEEDVAGKNPQLGEAIPRADLGPGSRPLPVWR
jgi:hypothetical protein